MSLKRFGFLLAVFGATACVSPSSDNYALPIPSKIIAVHPTGGITIKTESASRVHAAMTGRVISVKRYKDGTRGLVMDHGGGIRTEYSRLSRITAVRGERLRKGHTIGWIGENGSSAASLKFDMRVGKARVDPTRVLDLEGVIVGYGPMASAR